MTYKEGLRTRNALLSIVTGLFQKLISILIGFFSQWVFLRILGLECASLYGLFSSIFVFLSLAELGIGNVVTKRLYSPLASKDSEKIKTLMSFYKKSYRIIGIIIFTVGILITPHLSLIVNFESAPNVNLYLVFIIFLINTCCTYWLTGYKTSILEADQKKYIINKYETICDTSLNILKFLIILITNSYVLSLLGETVIKLLYNFLISRKINSLYPFLKDKDHLPISKESIKDMIVDIKALLIGKVAYRAVNITDTLIMSTMIGTIVIGKLYIYDSIINNLVAVISMVTASYIGGIGNLVYSENTNKQIDVYNELNLLNFWISCFSSACLFSLLNPFIKLFYGNDSTLQSSVLALSIVLCLAINFYFETERNNRETFCDVFGLWKYFKLTSIIGAIMNIVLDFISVQKYGLIGIYVSTFTCKALFNYLPQVYFLFTKGFKVSPLKEITKYFGYFCLMIFIVLITYFTSNAINGSNIISFIIKCFICVIVPNAILLVIFCKTRSFKMLMYRIKYIFSNYGGKIKHVN